VVSTASRRMKYPIERMTLGNMREFGIRSLDVSCWLCHHQAVLKPSRPRAMRTRQPDRFGCLSDTGHEKVPPLSGGAVRQTTHTADVDCSVVRAFDNSGSPPRQSLPAE
jgi:hypothetical protein